MFGAAVSGLKEAVFRWGMGSVLTKRTSWRSRRPMPWSGRWWRKTRYRVAQMDEVLRG